MFLPKMCKKGILVNKEFEAYMTHVWVNSSLVIGQFLLTAEDFITSATSVSWTDVVCRHVFITIAARDDPCWVSNWGHSQCITVTSWLSQDLGSGGRRGLQLSVQLGFSMLHPLMLPQPLFRHICVVTMVTGKHVHSWRGLPLTDPLTDRGRC